MQALVTGAGGFLGRYIVELLVARGDDVRTFARGEYPFLAELGADVVRGDIRDAHAVQRACRGVDVVFHAAAVADIWGPWEYFYGINTQGTSNVLAGCQTHGVSRLVYTSSPSVTFNGEEQCQIDEAAPYADRWLCHYPHTKALAEAAVLESHGQRGLATCALRPHLIWGPRDGHLIPRLIERANCGQLRQVGAGRNLVDMVFVENAAEAHLQAADALRVDSAVGGQAYFISQGEPVNCWTWINEILQLANQDPIRRRISFRMAWYVGSVLEVVHRIFPRTGEPRMTRFLAAQLAQSHFFDISKAQRDFGYRPRISTEEGMRRLADWLDNEGSRSKDGSVISPRHD